MDRFAEMEMFVRVVEAGGFTEAARRSGVSKSAVSKMIASLEQRLGARLLDRTTRRVNPTEIGLAYYDRATRVLADASEADAIAAALQAAPRGELRVSAPQSFGVRRLGGIVAEFLSSHPEVKVQMALDDRFVELVAEEFDLAIRVGALEDSSLRARRIGEARMALLASPNYVAANGAPASIDALSTHSLLHYSHLASGRSWTLVGQNGQPQKIRAGGRLAINNGDSLLSAVERDLGIALLPDFIYEDSLASGRVVTVLDEAAPEPLGIWAVTPPGRFTQPKVRVFVDFLADSLRLERRAGPAELRAAAE